MNTLTYILLFIIGVLLIKLYQKTQENKINYNNYRSCLKALAEYDESLAEYLEKRNIK